MRNANNGRKFPKVNNKVSKGKQIIHRYRLILQTQQQINSSDDMRKIVICLLLPILGILNPLGTNAAFEGRNALVLHSTKYADIDPENNRSPILQKSPAYIPLQASYDVHYIYMSSQTSVFGKYMVVDGNDEKALEGGFNTNSNVEQKIDISSLPEGDYTLQVTMGEQTLEGDFHVGE